MSTEVLRQAASLMRERAEALAEHARTNGEVTGGPDAHWSAAFLSNAIERHAPGSGDVVVANHAALGGEHLAPWHPAVALAVADWLDDIAETCALFDSKEIPASTWSMIWQTSCNRAFVVARAYLGGDR